LRSTGNEPSSSAVPSPDLLEKPPQIISEHEESSVPNFVLTSEPGKSIFDFPQPETIPTASNEAKSNEKSTPTSIFIQDSRTDSHDGKEKRPANKSVEHIPNKKTIKFKDAVGRKFSFPLDICNTWAVS